MSDNDAAASASSAGVDAHTHAHTEAPEVPAATTSAPYDDDMTEEGRTATALDPAIALRLQHAQRLVNVDNNLEEAAEVLTELLSTAAERYGQLCPILADMYYTYGDVLLRIAESKTDALEGGAAESDDEDGDEEAADGVAESKESEDATAPAEEDIEKDDEDGQDDAQLAFENLDVARLIYSRMANRDEATHLALARVHLRIGDSLSESDKFEEAVNEYLSSLAIRSSLLKPDDRRLADVLSCLSNTFIQMASDKGVTETNRKLFLSRALVYTQGAAECLSLAAVNTATALGATAMAQALQEEIRAGALQRQYPVGVTTSVARSIVDASSTSEPEVKVFTTVFSQHSSGVASSSSSGASAETIKEYCDIIDALVQRMSDIQADLGVSVSTILHEISGGNSAAATGKTTIGFGAATTSVGFGASTSAADAGAAATLVVRRKPEPSATSSATPANGAPTAAASGVQSGGTPESTAAATAAGSPAAAGQKRRLELDASEPAATTTESDGAEAVKMPRMATA